MLKKNNIYLAIIITLFFLVIASFTTFRIAIYSFVVCYIGVIIAKSKNKRLRVPVSDFFVLTFSIGILFAFIYSYSPKIQYYEFILLHSKWEISKVEKIDKKQISSIVINDLHIGTSVDADLFYKQDSLLSKQTFEFNFYEENLFDIFNQKKNTDIFASLELKKSTSDLFLFTKPNKEVYKVFNKNKLFDNSHSVTNLVFSILFLVLFVYGIFRFMLRPKKNISVILNQYPKRDFIISIVSIFYITVYLLFTFIV